MRPLASLIPRVLEKVSARLYDDANAFQSVRAMTSAIACAGLGAVVTDFLWWDRFPAGEFTGAGDSAIEVDSLGLASAAAFL